ncbi:MAG: glycosyl transferase family 9 [Ignavibacteria bacterium]|nr:glycosyl transferase family 9 [Ignavibacteria bacterium]
MLAKRIESINRKIIYFIISLFFRNKPRSTPLNPDSIKRVLIFRYDAIGDMIVTMPAVDVLGQILPDATIDVLASNRNYSIISNDTRFNNYFVYNGSFHSFFKIIFKLRSQKYDAVFAFVLHKTTKAGILANLIAGKKAAKVSIRHNKRAELYSTFFNVQLDVEEYRNRMTMAELQARMVCDCFGKNFDDYSLNYQIYIKEKHRIAARKILGNFSNKKLIAINISSGHHARFSKFIELIASISEKNNEYEFAIISVPSDYPLACTIAEKSYGKVTALNPSNDILEVCSLFEHFYAIITPDTSIVHIASAFKVPMIVMYVKSDSHVNEWMPFGVDFRCIITDGKKDLDSIEVQPVADAFDDLMKSIEKS